MGKTAVTVVAIVISAVIGFVVGKTNPNLSTSLSTSNISKLPTTSSLEAATNPLFKTQTATFQGKIISLSDNKLHVESETGEKGDISLSPSVTIYSFPKNSPIATSSSDLKTIEVGKMVLINLQLLNGKYQAVTISYFRTP